MKIIVMMLFAILTLIADTDLEKAMSSLERGDFKNAIKYFEKAAQEGDPIAQQNLAVMYHNGYGVKKDDTKASYWFEKVNENENRRIVTIR